MSAMTVDEYIASLGIELDEWQKELVRSSWTPKHVATYENGFEIPGLECQCDAEHRCGNHDDRAEQDYWLRRFNSTPIEDVREILFDSYERNDPKLYALLEEGV